MNILFIGGLGFIGWHSAALLQAQGHTVKILARRPSPLAVQAQAEVLYLDLQTADDDALRQLLSGFDCVIFGGGKDDRSMPKVEDVDAFFYAENVKPCVRLAECGKAVGVQKLIILGSYFAHFARSRPEWQMRERHPYVRSRLLQHEESVKAAGDALKVVTLEIPYVFGSAPRMKPLWCPLVAYLRKSPLIFYPEGGTNIVSINNLAQAICGAVERISQHAHIPVAGHNLSWAVFLRALLKALNQHKKIITLPYWMLMPTGYLTKLYFALSGKKSGLDIAWFMRVQCSNTFLDAAESQALLGYELEPLEKAFADTVKACEG